MESALHLGSFVRDPQCLLSSTLLGPWGAAPVVSPSGRRERSGASAGGSKVSWQSLERESFREHVNSGSFALQPAVGRVPGAGGRLSGGSGPAWGPCGEKQNKPAPLAPRSLPGVPLFGQLQRVTNFPCPRSAWLGSCAHRISEPDWIEIRRPANCRQQNPIEQRERGSWQERAVCPLTPEQAPGVKAALRGPLMLGLRLRVFPSLVPGLPLMQSFVFSSALWAHISLPEPGGERALAAAAHSAAARPVAGGFSRAVAAPVSPGSGSTAGSNVCKVSGTGPGACCVPGTRQQPLAALLSRVVCIPLASEV